MAAQEKGVMPHDLNCLTIAELEKHASLRMNKQTRDYYNEGADSGSTLLENTTAYSKYRIRPRVLRDISLIDTSVSLWGARNSVPIGVAPTAMQCLAHPDGEVATAKACRDARIAMGLSSFATSTLEDVASSIGGHPLVLQLYLFEEREHSSKLIQRAKKAGYKAVFLTVDTPMLGRRNMEIRNQFKLPKPYKIANFPEDSTSSASQAIMGGSSPKQEQGEQIKSTSTSQKGSHNGQTRHPPPPYLGREPASRHRRRRVTSARPR